MIEQKSVSILIVAYNPGRYLQNTLRSCIEQTYENTEILILDNASSEDTLDSMVQGFNGSIEMNDANNYKTIKISNYQTIKFYQSNENLGPYCGLNFLLEMAQGDYIAIQDHDDLWHPEKLEKQITFLESHPEYIGCGTNTIMYYESDQKYFEYFLGETNYYTIHPSLIFRNIAKSRLIQEGVSGNEFRYDTHDTEYMCDAWSLKTNLCYGKKCIYNLPEPLTLHLIKKGSGNLSYHWHTLNFRNIKRVYQLHSFGYATLTIGWEILRKILYPILGSIGLGKYVNTLERIPFILTGNRVQETRELDWWRKYIKP